MMRKTRNMKNNEKDFTKILSPINIRKKKLINQNQKKSQKTFKYSLKKEREKKYSKENTKNGESLITRRLPGDFLVLSN